MYSNDNGGLTINTCLFLLCFLTALAPAGGADNEPAAGLGDIVVEVSGLRNEAGMLRILLFNGAKGFPEDREKAIAIDSVPIDSDTVSVTLQKIPKGEYAIAVLHDEDKDGMLDSNWLGLPKEGVGVSNNVKSKLGPPKYRDARFPHISKRTILNITVNYFF